MESWRTLQETLTAACDAPDEDTAERAVRAAELVAASERVVAEFDLEWFFSIQFMGDKVIEINPRISTMMIQEDFNLPWLAVKRALGEASDDELRAFQDRVRPGHTVLRFFEQVEFDP